MRALVDVAKDWHRSGAGEYPNSSETFSGQREQVIEETVVVPAIESKTAIDQIDEILEMPRLRAIQFGSTDLSKEIGYAFQYEHPAVWKAIRDISDKARSRGILVVANTGYDLTTVDAIAGRVGRLYDHGMRVVLMQGAEFLLETLTKPLVEQIHRSR
ncbi:hypothetical protein ADU59_21595 [Pararhizobium polonicum]|uniref:HpcH/HpaI aldolase/citrate lyase domain-containing protein n=1 Tax=Pararhizobium polonicum TaxID=1612624 RepID=A0A1C7NWR9_9HYPH|nr:aldolase/citrate lyase family protein [Pararhizobium polonicum]OBZ93450.1 hypothetical protein ADU59_21595 [Pararhizobium polonicum]